MKRIVPTALVFIALAVGAFVFFQPEKPHRPRAAELVPPETLLFVHLLDVRRSVARWPVTGLAQIWEEPEMQAFLELPRRKMPLMRQAKATLARLERVGPREGFAALTALDGVTPKFVAGFAFSGSGGAAIELMAEPRAAWKSAWPGGRSGRLNFGGCEVQTYELPEQTIVECFHGGWYFIANDLEILKPVLDRCDGRLGPGLASTEIFQRNVAALPAELDGQLFARFGVLRDRLGSLLAGTPLVESSEAGTGDSALAWGTKLEGAQVRDTILISGPGSAAPALARDTRALSSPDSVLYAAMTLPTQLEVPAAFASMLALAAPALASVEGDLTRRQITWAEFGAAFGPEMGLLVEWPEQADAPALLLAVAVRDQLKARSFVAALTAPVAGGESWRREEEDGVLRYESPMGPAGGAAPGIALSSRFAVLGANALAVSEALARSAAVAPALDASATHQAIASQVRPPTTGYVYLDLRMVFERSYAMLRPFLAMSLSFSPEVGSYLDASKLPSTEAVARHLGPSVFSQSVTDQGTRIESVGTFAFSQTLASALAGAWTSAGASLNGKTEKNAGFDPTILFGRPARSRPAPPAAAPVPADHTGDEAKISPSPRGGPESVTPEPSQP